eukprot:jgi/Botrbrau1/3659/Bobra.0204s0049.1
MLERCGGWLVPCRLRLVSGLLETSAMAGVLIFLCSSAMVSTDAGLLESSNCSYRPAYDKNFPYPYDSHDWLPLLYKGQQRRPPLALRKALSGSNERRKEAHMHSIFQHKFLLPESLLTRGRGNIGDLTRLRVVLMKLLSGHPIKVVVLGGSIMGGGEVYVLRQPTDSFVGQIFTWINETFPHPDHKFHNGALPATGSAFIAICLSHHLPYDDVDLVIMEFDINDATPGYLEKRTMTFDQNIKRRSLENLMRQVLSMQNQPALLYFHMWMPGYHMDTFQGTTIEDETEIFVEYYGLQSVSYRNAVYLPHAEGVFGFRSAEISCSQVHPTYLAHRYMADLVLAFLQDELASLLLEHSSHEPIASLPKELPPPIFANNTNKFGVCLEEKDLESASIERRGWIFENEFTTYGGRKYHWLSTQSWGDNQAQAEHSRSSQSRQA